MLDEREVQGEFTSSLMEILEGIKKLDDFFHSLKGDQEGGQGIQCNEKMVSLPSLNAHSMSILLIRGYSWLAQRQKVKEEGPDRMSLLSPTIYARLQIR